MKKKCLRNAVAASVSDRPTARAGNTLGMFCLSITFITCLDAACPTGPRKILRRPRMSPGFGTRPAGRAVVALLPFFSVPHLGDTGGKRATVIPGKHVHKLTAFFLTQSAAFNLKNCSFSDHSELDSGRYCLFYEFVTVQ